MDCRVIIKTHFGPIIIAIYSILFVLMPVAEERKKNQKYKLTKAMAKNVKPKKIENHDSVFFCAVIRQSQCSHIAPSTTVKCERSSYKGLNI